MKGANSGGVFRKMRGKAMALTPLRCRGFLLPEYQVLSSNNIIQQNVEEDE
jgi:hypothetical protein